MHLEQLELIDYRNYVEGRVRLSAGPHVFVGANAQGKTNLLEAIHYLGVGHSHRVTADGPLVRAGADAAVVRAHARTDAGRGLSVELELRPGGRNRVKRNGQAQPRVQDALGHLRSVLFAPEDVMLVRGEPGERRRFLDDLLVQRRPAYLAARRDYERVLRQRNALLRAARAGHGRAAREGPSRVAREGPSSDEATLAAWTDALASAGAPLVAARLAAVHGLAGPAAEAYQNLVADAAPRGTADRPRLVYELSTGREVVGQPGCGIPDLEEVTAELREGLEAVAEEERERGVTLAGPHRDDLALSLHDLPAKGYASQGEQWSLALSLRLASRDVLAEVGDEPIILLDDVFAELDAQRRARLAQRCGEFAQVLITTAVDGDVPVDGPRAHVDGGAVTQPGTDVGREAG